MRMVGKKLSLNLVNQTNESEYVDDDGDLLTEDVGEVEESEEQEVTKVRTLPLYYVDSSKCKIPYVDPFGPDTLAVYTPMKFETCSNETALVTPIFNHNMKRYVLHINETLATILLNSSDIDYNCYYLEIVRDQAHDSYNSLNRKYFSQGFVVPHHVQGLVVTCHKFDNDSFVLQHDGYSVIQYVPPPPGISNLPGKRKPSVIMFGIDSLSRINIRRTMPKTYNYLTGSGWYEMQGYNKIGDNTFPNLMAILTGYTPKTAKELICDWDKDGCLDRIPFIWHYMKNASYLTAMGEDESGMATFNYCKPGFVQQPTDYYARPQHKAFEHFLDKWKCAECEMTYCIGRRITSSYIYDFGRDFVNRYVDERPIFGLFWSNSFSHNDYRMTSKMDDYILQYMLDFETDGVFEQSIMIFLSDHGSRYGKILGFESGFLEERLPAMFIYLPPWFRAHYPEFTKALQLNQNRLTSNFDLHNTLKHIIELGGTPDGPALPRSNDCPKCHSLFYTHDPERTCDDAGIPEHFCTCVPYKRLKGKWASRIAPKVIDRINEYLERRNLSEICSTLTLSYIHRTEIKIELEENFHDEMSTKDVAIYRTKFKVRPNGADFYATVTFNNVTENVDVDVETISRTTSYERDATCVSDKMAKLYCICKSNVRD
ncbi:uncharacterized protein Dwil_GK12100 [Drosophila willistoni]|uniref:DUF229 domain containing protein n=1 Tax=Drosophila willistoni TaxID=7260 RepID=B4N8P6_DROWI|nr:uncharacterized protein LOC6646878 [Drosophila willistoni]EDW81497.2 uncharacterized protein Dwil_GK12100 [Drosophila willistoni]